jgi:hypothetical protein
VDEANLKLYKVTIKWESAVSAGSWTTLVEAASEDKAENVAYYRAWLHAPANELIGKAVAERVETFPDPGGRGWLARVNWESDRARGALTLIAASEDDEAAERQAEKDFLAAAPDILLDRAEVQDIKFEEAGAGVEKDFPAVYRDDPDDGRDDSPDPAEEEFLRELRGLI